MPSARPNLASRKRLRLGLLAVVFILAGVAYWQYLQRLMHGPASHQVATVAAASAKAATATETVVKTTTATGVATAAASTATPVPAKTQSPSSLKQAADAGVMAVATYLVESVKSHTVAAQPQVAPVSPPAVKSAPVAAPAVPKPAPYVVAQPTATRPTLVHTPEERLRMAGAEAMEQMLGKAGKYPDAYGFGASDLFKQATLGDPIPVYTIEETARANYKSGQPLRPLLKPAKEWVFPVLAGSHVCCMVSVSREGEDYLPGNSSKALALAWNKISKMWPATEGYHPQLVVNPAIPGHYFTIPELPTPNITDTVQMTLLHPSLSPADVILASWR